MTAGEKKDKGPQSPDSSWEQGAPDATLLGQPPKTKAPTSTRNPKVTSSENVVAATLVGDPTAATRSPSQPQSERGRSRTRADGTAPGTKKEPSQEAMAATLAAPLAGEAATPQGASSPAATQGLQLGTDPTQTSGPLGGGATASSGQGPDEGLPFEEGMRIRQYELIRELGRGGMGQVFLARDRKLGRRVAIKFLHQVSEDFNERFIREAQTTARCNHENIVVIYEVNEYEGRPFMVLEYLEGQPLSELMKDQKLPPARTVEIMVPVVKALVRAHEFGIVHRDLKPDNIFVCNSGVIKVLDFGIAKLFAESAEDGSGGEAVTLQPNATFSEALGLKGQTGSDSDLTREGAIVGTMTYMSPEQWGAAPVDHRTDIWAAGIILYEMLTGENPLGALSVRQLMVNAVMQNEPMPSLAKKAPGLPGGFSRVVDKCLQKDKGLRYKDAQTLLEELEPLLPSRHVKQLEADENPYPGLTAFQERDAGRFFGRNREIVKLANQIRERPINAVVGPSGVGKSSFVRAGVIPALKDSGEPWETFVTRPGRSPLAALAGLLQPITRSTTADLNERIREQEALTKRLRKEPGYLGTILRSRARRENESILLFVDQFEELYTLVDDPEERKAYTACLTGAADDASAPLRVVVSMRSDFLDRAAEDSRFVEELTRGLMFLQPPDKEGLTEAITMPARMAGFSFEDEGMVEDMLDELSDTPGALPLLQFSASKLWDNRDQKRQLLTRSAYDAMGGIGGALATHADEVMSALGPPAQKLLRALLLRLVTSDGTRAITDVSELLALSEDPDEVQRLVGYLVEARLLTVHSRGREEGRAVELVHESLLTNWPRLKKWLDESQEDSVFLEQLRTAAKQWDTKGRVQGLLWRGESVDEARRFLNRHKGPLSSNEREYLQATISLADRSSRLRRRLMVGTMVFLVLLVAAAAVALVWIRSAEQKAKDQAVLAKKEAKKARSAENHAKKQFEALQAEQKRRLSAEKEAKTAKTEVKVKQRNLATAKKELKMSYAQLQEALKTAQDQKARAEKATVTAKKALNKAQTASRELEKMATSQKEANKKLKKLLSRKQRRIKKLLKQRQKIETTLR